MSDALGEFEHQVLLTLVILGGEAYSAPVVMELERRTGRLASAAAVFIALRRLERRGYLRSRKTEPAPGEGGRGRRTFEVTPRALARLRESRRTLEGLWRAAEPLLGEP